MVQYKINDIDLKQKAPQFAGLLTLGYELFYLLVNRIIA